MANRTCAVCGGSFEAPPACCGVCPGECDEDLYLGAPCCSKECERILHRGVANQPDMTELPYHTTRKGRGPVVSSKYLKL